MKFVPNMLNIWPRLREAGLSPEGTAGLMGNLYAESGLNPIAVERLLLNYLKKTGRHYNDATYTMEVDEGTISKEEFLHPFPGYQYGYGLAQWTYWTRKQALYEFAKKQNTSIGNLNMQVEFLIHELKTDYKAVWEALKNSREIWNAAVIVLRQFEQPADMSNAVMNERAENARYIYDYCMKHFEEKEESMHIISNCGHDENGNYYNGIAGDQTGKEWELIAWYSRPWNCVLRHPSSAVREKLAELAEKAAKNNHIGYDQWQRNTYWTYLREAGYDPSKITVNCETDCSKGVIDHVRAVGYLLDLDSLKNVNATYTGNMRSGFAAAGFIVLTDSKYLNSPDYLLPGDILLNDQHHTATNISMGSKATGSLSQEPASTGAVGTCQVTLKMFVQGAKDPQVRAIQALLNAKGYRGKDGKALTVDGDLGPNTQYAITCMQKDKGMTGINFGSVAGTTWKYLLEG